jgi:hypothetical protein
MRSRQPHRWTTARFRDVTADGCARPVLCIVLCTWFTWTQYLRPRTRDWSGTPGRRAPKAAFDVQTARMHKAPLYSTKVWIFRKGPETADSPISHVYSRPSSCYVTPSDWDDSARAGASVNAVAACPGFGRTITARSSSPRADEVFVHARRSGGQERLIVVEFRQYIFMHGA